MNICHLTYQEPQGLTNGGSSNDSLNHVAFLYFVGTGANRKQRFAQWHSI
jgi:hypothetical protein